MPRDFGRKEEKIFLNVLLLFFFSPFFTAIKVFTQEQYDGDCVFFILCLVWIRHFFLAQQFDHPAVSATSCPGGLFFFSLQILMHAGQSLSADPSIRCRLIIPRCPWNSPLQLCLLCYHFPYVISSGHFEDFSISQSKLDCSTWPYWQYLDVSDESPELKKRDAAFRRDYYHYIDLPSYT